MTSIEKVWIKAADDIATKVIRPDGKNNKRAIGPIMKTLIAAYVALGFDEIIASEQAIDFITSRC